ncbi:hypothetical protein NQZ68_033105, partial [Dissostichus eleginoides]
VKMGNKVEVCFKNDPSEEDIDCMVTSEGVASDILIYTIKEVSIPPAPSVANINTDGMGYIDLKFNTGYSNDELSTKVGGTVMATWKDPKEIFFYRDLSGCRGSGGAVMPGSEMPRAEPCSVELCSLSAVLSNTACGPEEVCQADNTCAIPPVVCTVTGSTVIGFHGAVHSVQDRCTYSLMEPEGSASFNLMAAFRERRRTDVPLLDHLILSLPGVTMYLEQGGRVRVGGEALVLSSTAQQHHGVELSKDQAGVTAKLPNSNMTLYFDGSTAHVSGTEHVSAEKSSSFSPPGYPLVCLISAVSNDMVLFLQTPGYPLVCLISAVSNDMVLFLQTPGYPLVCLISAVSNDMVLFLQTPGYPLVCLTSAVSNDMVLFLQTPPAVSNDMVLFLQIPPGYPLVCLISAVSNDMVLFLQTPGCEIQQQDTIDSSINCTSSTDQMEPSARNNSQIVYKNSIMSSNSSSGGVIIRSDQIQIDFSCKYTQPEVRSVSFRIQDSSVVQQQVSGVWDYTLTMSSFSDAGLLQPVGPNTEILLNQKVWLQLAAGGLDANMVAMVTDSCWATNQASPDDSLRYDLIINGCPNPADDTVQMQGNGQGTSSVFSFNMFEFSGGSSEIYLHCKLELCPTQGQACTPSCGGVLAGGVDLLDLQKETLPSSRWPGLIKEPYMMIPDFVSIKKKKRKSPEIGSSWSEIIPDDSSYSEM